MKDVSKNKFLLCFRPVVVDHIDLVIESNGAVDKDSMIKSSTLEGKKSDNPMTVRPPKRKFSRAIKAVVFEMILAKRARDRKGLGQNHRESKQVSSSMNSTVSDDDDGASTNRVFDSSREIKSNSGLSSSSSSFDSSSSPSISTPESKINVSKSLSDSKKHRKSSYSTSPNSGIYFLLLSLTLTILWGKLCAILVTSVWLYLLPRRRTRDGFRPESVIIKTSPETDSAEYNKKIIMEGLLERNHHSRLAEGDRGH